MKAESSTKRVYLELLRILCAGLVIFNHIPGYTLYQTISGPKRIPCLFLTMFTRINVPVFFMITGALLLDRQEDYRTVFRKRVVRILSLIVIAQSAYYCCAWFSDNYLRQRETAFSFGALLRGILSGNKGAEAYWFLYSYLGLMLLFYILCGLDTAGVLSLIAGVAVIAGTCEAIAAAVLCTPILAALRRVRR